MSQTTYTIYEMQAVIMKALAHSTRIQIVQELKEKELCVSEITSLIAADTSTVSKHLSVLKNAGIISDQKRGLNVYYTLKMPCVLKFFTCIDDVLKERVKDQIVMLL